MQSPIAETQAPAGRFVLSFDLEDWQQLVGRYAGLDGWDVAHAAFERQVGVVLDLLDELEVKATFFVLGMSVRNHPHVCREVASRGHEIASHGGSHQRVYAQTPEEFRADLETSSALIEELCGKRPTGYRAPAFSITRDTLWAYEVLADAGFRYDSSQYDSPRIGRRIGGIPGDPYRLQLDSGRELWEFPIAVWRRGGRRFPIGGGGYWRAIPSRILTSGLHEVARSSSFPVLYFHPYECDPLPLKPDLPPTVTLEQRLKATSRSVYRNPGRARTVQQIRRLAQDFPLVTYEQLFQDEALGNASTRALSADGVLV